VSDQRKSRWEQFPALLGATAAMLAAMVSLFVALKNDKKEIPPFATKAQLVGRDTPQGQKNGMVKIDSKSGLQRPEEANEENSSRESESNGKPELVNEAIKCAQKNTLRSPRTIQSATITFINRSDTEIRIYWIDHEGRSVEIPSGGKLVPLLPGQMRAQPTVLEHKWMVTDSVGSCRQIVTALSEESTYVYQ
jgi:hypothetical protein